MTSIVPHRFLFRFSVRVPYVDRIRKRNDPYLELGEDSRVPDFSALDESDSRASASFASLYLGWNDDGLGLRLAVRGKKMPVDCDLLQPANSDGLQVWIDTRSTETIHRASRYCHQFAFFPTGGGKKGKEPALRQMPIAQAREPSPVVRSGLIRVKSEIEQGGYALDVWFPGEALNGYDPESSVKLGFNYLVRDAELGEQYMTVGREFPIEYDPSLWTTLELNR